MNRTEEAKNQIVPFVLGILGTMQNPVLKAWYDDNDDEIVFTDHQEIASIIADDYKYLIVCNVPLETVKMKIARLVTDGYSWLNNCVEFYLNANN